MKTSQAIIDQLNKDLSSDNDSTVIEAISTVRQKGDARIVKNLIALLSHKNTEINSSAKNVLFDLKDKEAVHEILNEFDGIKDLEIRNILLQSLWQSNIHPVNAVNRLTKIAITGSLEECIEVHSIITNIIDELIPDEEIMDSILTINNAITDLRDKHKKQLLEDIVHFLNEHQDNK